MRQGRFGFDYVSHPHRLMRPLIRKEGVAKVVDDDIDPGNPLTHFREASWEEALDLAANGLRAIRDRDGARASPASARPRAPTRKPIWCRR